MTLRSATLESASLWPPSGTVVHLWRINLRRVARAMLGQGWILSADEQTRAARLSDAARRRQFAASRTALRTILGAYLGIAPEQVVFMYGPHGKPALAGDGGGLSFNLSHAAGYAVCAVAQDRAVGVDIEVIRPVPAALALARKAFPPAEVDRLSLLPTAARSKAFLRCWTRREAVAKAAGSALAHILGERIAAFPAGPMSDPQAGGCAAEAWSLRDLDLPPSHLGALALRGCITELRPIDFP